MKLAKILLYVRKHIVLFHEIASFWNYVQLISNDSSESEYSTRTIITRGLNTFYPLFEVHLCTVTFSLMYG